MKLILFNFDYKFDHCNFDCLFYILFSHSMNSKNEYCIKM